MLTTGHMNNFKKVCTVAKKVSSNMTGHDQTYIYTHLIYENKTSDSDILQTDIVL